MRIARFVFVLALAFSCLPLMAAEVVAPKPAPTPSFLSVPQGCGVPVAAPAQRTTAALPAADSFAPAPEAKSEFPEYCEQFYCPYAHPVFACQCGCDVEACYCWNACAETDFFCYERCRDAMNNCYLGCQSL